MKVLNLQCCHGHAFEGWFASHDDFESQCARGMLTCPVCHAGEVQKMPSAPRLNLGHRAVSEAVAVPAEAESSGPPQGGGQAMSQPLQAAWMRMVRHIMANTEDVGTQFAEEARKIHHGETKERHIRGQASQEEAEALLEEGIDILPLPVPAGFKETLQ